MNEWQKRLADKWWRLNNLYKIKNKSGELITFEPNYIQTKHIIERKSHRYNLIVKARQFGFTTLYSIEFLDDALWEGTTGGIIAHEAKKLPEYFDIVKRAYENLHEDIKPKTKTDTKYRYDFVEKYDGTPMDTSIYVAVKMRGGTVQNLHITESAYIKDRQELNAGSKQAVPLTGRISEETTGNGFNEFYDFYSSNDGNPNPGPMDYKTYFYAWWENPEYTLPGTLEDKTATELELLEKYPLTDGQLLWRRWKIKELAADVEKRALGLSGEQLFKQEYPATKQEAFQSGAGSVFDPEKLDAITPRKPYNPMTVPQEDPDKVERFKGFFKKGFAFWYLPEKEHQYVVGVDPSDGEGADSSCIDVWDRNTKKQVCQLYTKVRPDELAELAVEISEFYNHAFLGVESNMLSTILFVTKIYDNYYFQTVVDERTAKKTKKIGWHTNTKTRDLMIDEFIIPFEEDTLEINSPITIREMKTFVKKETGKREHADGKHDDALFAGFVAIQMMKFFKDKPRFFTEKPVGF